MLVLEADICYAAELFDFSLIYGGSSCAFPNYLLFITNLPGEFDWGLNTGNAPPLLFLAGVDY